MITSEPQDESHLVCKANAAIDLRPLDDEVSFGVGKGKAREDGSSSRRERVDDMNVEITLVPLPSNARSVSAPQRLPSGDDSTGRSRRILHEHEYSIFVHDCEFDCSVGVPEDMYFERPRHAVFEQGVVEPPIVRDRVV